MSKVQNGKLYYQLFQNNVADSKFYQMWYAKAKHIDTVTFDELISGGPACGFLFSLLSIVIS